MKLFTTILLLLFAHSLNAKVVESKTPTWLTDNTQLVLVTVKDWQAATGELQTFERIDGQWQTVAEPFPVSIGKNGSAWGLGLHPIQSNGLLKVEGDGKSPAGIFKIGKGFGYTPMPNTKLTYQTMTDMDWCVDVVTSPLYNQIVSTKDVTIQAVEGSSEPMRRDLHLNGDLLYQRGFVIEHNPNNIPKSGSCIFAHIWRSPSVGTAGCTAMDAIHMDSLMQWLDTNKSPVFVLLPMTEYKKLQKSWSLPKLKEKL